MKTFLTIVLASVLSHPCLAQLNDTAHQADRRLKEVTVTAQGPLIKSDGEKISYDLRADPQSLVSNLLEILRKVPRLSIDADEKLLLNGSARYRILVNGRPSGLMTGNPEEILRSIPASTVKSIEVVTNPPARYDAEGLAGIINIVTLRQKHQGYQGTVNASMKAPTGGPGAGCSITCKYQRLGLSASAGYHRNDLPVTTRDNYRTSIPPGSSAMQQHITSSIKAATAYGDAELSYEIDSLNLVTGQFSGRRSQSSGQAAQATMLVTAGSDQYYELKHTHSMEDRIVEAAINYQHGFKKSKDRLLTVSYQYLSETGGLQNLVNLSHQINYNASDYRQHNSRSFREHTFQIDYMQPVNKWMIEAGIKNIVRIQTSEFGQHNADTATGVYQPDLTRSDLFRNRQQILSVYSSCKWQSTRWQLKAGLRAEQTFLRGNLGQEPEAIRHRYFNLLPSLSASRTLDDHNSLSLAFSGRIQRPSSSELNPFTDRSNPKLVSAGNPYLRPITSYLCELNYLHSAKASFNLSLGAMFFNNVFNALAFFDSASNTVINRIENIGSGRVIKFNTYLNKPFSDRLTCMVQTDIRYVTVKGAYPDGDVIENQGLDLYVAASAVYQLKGDWRVHTELTYRKGGLLLPVGRTNGFTALAVILSKSILQGRVTMSASLHNPFARYRYVEETVYGPDFQQTSYKQVYFRRYGFSVNYRFGHLSGNIKKNLRGIRNEDTGG